MPSGRIRTSLHAAAALAVGLVLRLWLIAHTASVNGDTLIYGSIAANWLRHGVYGFLTTAKGPVPTLIRLPGYPLFLAACFALFGVERYTAVMLLQCLFDLLTCLLAAALAGRLFGPRARLAVLWIAALCPFTAAYAAAPLTEVLTLTTIALAFYSLERWRAAGLGLNRWLWIASLAMAYSLLLRPEQGLLAAAIIPAILWLSRSPQPPNRQRSPGAPSFAPLRRAGDKPSPRTLSTFVPAILACLCVLLPLVPWTVRNGRTFHVFQPLAPRSATDPGENVPRGFNRWYRTWGIDYASTETVYWNYDNAQIDIGDLPTRAFDSSGQYARTAALLADYNQTCNATPALDARFNAIAERRIHADPIRYYLALPIARLLNMTLRPRAEMLAVSLDWWRYREHPRQTLEAAALAALNLAYLVLGAAGLWLWRRSGWGPHAPLAWSMLGYLILRCALLLTLDNSEPRYTLELFPLLFVWAGFLFRPRRSLKIKLKSWCTSSPLEIVSSYKDRGREPLIKSLLLSSRPSPSVISTAATQSELP